MNNQVFNFGCLVFGGQGRPNIDLVMWSTGVQKNRKTE